MYEIHIRGKKKAVQLIMANIIGYGTDVTFEEGDADKYTVHCEVTTRWDTDPFGIREKEWDGNVADLAAYSEEGIANDDYFNCFEGYGAAYLSGHLGVEIEMLNRTEETANPFNVFQRFVDGALVKRSSFENPNYEEQDYDDEDYYDEDEFDEDEFDEDDEDEALEEEGLKFDEWHDFSF